MKATFISVITILLAVISTGISYRHEHTAEMHARKARQYASDMSNIRAELKKIIDIQPNAGDEIFQDMETCQRKELIEPPGCREIVSAQQGPTLADKRRHAECTSAINVFIDETQIRQSDEVACRLQVIQRYKQNDRRRSDNLAFENTSRHSPDSRDNDRSSKNGRHHDNDTDDSHLDPENETRRSSSRVHSDFDSGNRDRSSENSRGSSRNQHHRPDSKK